MLGALSSGLGCKVYHPRICLLPGLRMITALSMLPLYAFMAWTERFLSVVLFSLLSFPCLFPVLSSNILSNLISGVLYFCTFLRLIHRASHFCRTVDTVVIYLCIYLFIYFCEKEAWKKKFWHEWHEWHLCSYFIILVYFYSNKFSLLIFFLIMHWET